MASLTQEDRAMAAKMECEPEAYAQTKAQLETREQESPAGLRYEESEYRGSHRGFNWSPEDRAALPLLTQGQLDALHSFPDWTPLSLLNADRELAAARVSKGSAATAFDESSLNAGTRSYYRTLDAAAQEQFRATFLAAAKSSNGRSR